MPVEVVSEQSSELFARLNVWARVDKMATGQRFVEGRVVSAVKFVHHHFPDRVWPWWAVSSVSVALVGHTEVQSVRPDWNAAEGRGDGSVVDEELVGHHLELLVSTDPKVRGSHSDDWTVTDVSESFDDQTSTSHLGKPVVVRALSPVLRIVLVG